MQVHSSFVRSCLIGMGSAIALVATACSSGDPALIGGDRGKVEPGETGGSKDTADAGTAGKPEGGGSGAGGSSGSAGSPAGSGGDTDVCSLPPGESGPCDAYMERWAYDPSAQDCVKFVYGGCGGNANRFESHDACMARCGDPGSSPCGEERQATLDFIAAHKACTVDADCQVTPGGCSITEASCTGLVFVNNEASGDEFDQLRQSLHDCLGAAVCDGPMCALGVLPPSCVEGRCVPGTLP